MTPTIIQNNHCKTFDVSVDYLIGLIDEPLSFNRNIRSVSLPQSFTKEECGDVLDYIKYLEFKRVKLMNKNNPYPRVR